MDALVDIRHHIWLSKYGCMAGLMLIWCLIFSYLELLCCQELPTSYWNIGGPKELQKENLTGSSERVSMKLKLGLYNNFLGIMIELPPCSIITSEPPSRRAQRQCH